MLITWPMAKWERGEVDVPLRLSHPLGHQVTTGHTKESALGLCRDRLCQKRLSRSRRSVEQDTPPWRPLASKELRKLDGQDDCLLERFLGLGETGHIVPLDIGRFRQDGALQTLAQLLDLRIIVVASSAAVALDIWSARR